MQYHIQTTPIWDAFKSGCDCPLCAIYEKSSNRLVEQYLNEAVMEPEFRVRVNKLGFCDKHLKQLFIGKNKLGLALQLNTRTQYIIDKYLTVCDLPKQAIKLADNLDKTLSTCVICETVNEMMERYAYTIAQMYLQEASFPETFKKSNGFCLPHFALLLRFGNKAGKMSAQYLSDLTGLQISSMSKTNSDTDRFTQKFDYRNAGSSSTPDPDTVPNAIKKLRGRIL